MLDLTKIGSAMAKPGKTGVPGPPAKVDPRLVAGARQFEAMMLQQMLKPMHFGSSPDTAGEADATGSNDTLSGFGTEAVAQALASGKGFGLARQIVRQVTVEHESRTPSTGGIQVP